MLTLELNCVVKWVVCELGSRGLDIVPKPTNALKYRGIQEESARLREMIVCVILSKNVHTNMGPILNGYGVTTA